MNNWKSKNRRKYLLQFKYMETDKDHIHYMIETTPNVALSWVVDLLKSYTTFHIWRLHQNVLRKYFWKENTLSLFPYFPSIFHHFSPLLPIHHLYCGKCGEFCGKLAIFACEYPINHRKIPINAQKPC